MITTVVDYQYPVNRYTGAHCAILKSDSANVKCLSLLLEAGASLDIRNADGKTVIDLLLEPQAGASRLGDVQVTRFNVEALQATLRYEQLLYCPEVELSSVAMKSDA